MQWSKFNYLYFSQKHNIYLLYNSLSNCFINVDDEELKNLLLKMQKDIVVEKNQEYSELYETLKEKKILVESNELEVMKIKQEVLLNRYSCNTIALTILPTLSCNFKCPYCFEKEENNISMNDKVQDSIVKFIEKATANNKSTMLNISWMGGEPLLRFDIIKKLTKKIQKLNVIINASIVTNGFLLSKQKAKLLLSMGINHIQITLDGLGEENNKTRIHKQEGIDTFKEIIKNIDEFYKVDGICDKISINIRVNLNKNEENYTLKFLRTYVFLRKRYQYRNFYISPGFIEDIKSNGATLNCEFDRASIKDFFCDMVKFGVKEFSLYPKDRICECSVRSPQDYVIGPKGELYSCWENIGLKENTIGFLDENGTPKLTNELLRYRYLVSADYINSEECLSCFLLPVCDGGCPEKRIRNCKNNACFDVCAVQKDNIQEILDLHYEIREK
jgi:uncharacterized protein